MNIRFSVNVDVKNKYTQYQISKSAKFTIFEKTPLPIWKTLCTIMRTDSNEDQLEINIWN